MTSMSDNANAVGLDRWASHSFAFFSLVVLAFYLLDASAYLIGTDNPEFVIISHVGGVGHPPGFPLYALYLEWVAPWIPVDSVPHRASLATALLGWLAMVLLYPAARAWGCSALGAGAGALFSGCSGATWLVNTHAEVFAMNHLFVALILWWAAPHGPWKGTRRLVALGAAAGLAISNHHIAVLMAPVGLWGAWRGWTEAKRSWASLFAAVLAFAAGLTPYLSFFAAASNADAFVWGDFKGPNRWQAVFDHFLRREYGTFSHGPGSGVSAWDHLALYLGEMGLDLAVVGFVLGVFGIVKLTQSALDPSCDDRWAKGALVASFWVAGPLFVSRLTSAVSGAGYDVTRRFHSMPTLVWALLIAWGVDRLRRQYRLSTPVWGALLGISLVAAGARSMTITQPRYVDSMERYVEHLWASVPEEAIIVGTGTHRYLLAEYSQRVAQERPDVVFVEMHMLSRGWYVDRLEERLGISLPRPDVMEDGSKRLRTPEIFQRLRDTRRPLFLSNRFSSSAVDALVVEPRGVVWEVVDEAKTTSHADLWRRNRDIFDAIEPPSLLPTYEDHAWAWSLYAEYQHLFAAMIQRCPDASCRQHWRDEQRRFGGVPNESDDRPSAAEAQGTLGSHTTQPARDRRLASGQEKSGEVATAFRDRSRLRRLAVGQDRAVWGR